MPNGVATFLGMSRNSGDFQIMATPTIKYREAIIRTMYFITASKPVSRFLSGRGLISDIQFEFNGEYETHFYSVTILLSGLPVGHDTHHT
jgi:hypothetical protein